MCSTGYLNSSSGASGTLNTVGRFTPNINYSDFVRRLASPNQCSIDVDTLRQIRTLLRCIQQPVVAYDSNLLTMVQSAVGYCGEKAAEIEALLPRHGMLEDGE